jgi:hypothetical protein
MRENLNAIKRTLDLYDPDHRTVVVGTAALALQGIKVPGGVPDVDTLSSEDHLIDLVGAMEEDCFDGNASKLEGSVDVRGITVLPDNDSNNGQNLLQYQSFYETTAEDFDMDYYLAYSRSIIVGDYRALPIHEVLRWKASIGREKDLNKVQKILSRRSIKSYLPPDMKNEIQRIAIRNRKLLVASAPVRETGYGGQLAVSERGYGSTGYSRSTSVSSTYPVVKAILYG